MKRTLSLVLALVMILGTIPAFAAAPTVNEAAKFLNEEKVLIGDNSGNLNLEAGLRRQESVIMLARLLGEEGVALATEGAPTWGDVKDPYWNPVLKWAQDAEWYKGHSNVRFGYDEVITAQDYGLVLLRALGFETAWEEAYEKALELGLFEDIGEKTEITRAQMAVATYVALGTEMADGEKTLAEELEIEMPAEEVDELGVVSVKASSARSFKVEFNKAVADADNLSYEVKRGNTQVVVTPEYSEDKLSVELKSTATFAVGDYSVAVLSNDEELAKETITIEAQKLAEIKITSTVLSVTNNPEINNNQQYGYATFVAYDQYGVNVTNSYLAQNITFLSGAGNVTAKNGILTLIPSANVNLIALPTVAISGYDTQSGVTVTANLTPAVAVGTLKSFELLPTDIVSVVAGDTTTVIYIPYKAVDMSGNETRNLNFVKNGLILGENDSITVTNNWVNASVVEDPANPGEAAIKVVANSNTPGEFNIDLPFNITAMTKTGSVSTIAGVLKPTPSIQTITLYAPTQVVAAGDAYAVIPYEAYSKDGSKLTKTSQINPENTLGLTTNSGDLRYTTLVDGTMELRAQVPGTKGPKMYNVSVKNTGHFSNITVTVQDPAVADSLTTSLVSRALEVGSNVKVGFGYLNTLPSFGGLSVKDNYGRDIDMVLGGHSYVVEVSKQNPSSTVLSVYDKDNTTAINLTAGNVYEIGAGAEGINVKANAKGSETLVFRLLDAPGGNEVARRTHTFTVVNTNEIVSYTVAPAASTIYTGGSAYNTGFTVRGRTLSGTEVQLVNAVVSAKPSNTTDFASGGSNVYAKDSSSGYVAKASETDVNVTVIHGNNVAMLNTSIKSSTVAPVATSIGFSITHDEALGSNHSFVNDVLTLKAGQFDNVTNIAGITANGFSVTDSYKKAGAVANYYVSDLAAQNVTGVAINQEGEFTITGGSNNFAAFKAGDTFKITAVTNNGLVKTIQVVFN